MELDSGFLPSSGGEAVQGSEVNFHLTWLAAALPGPPCENSNNSLLSLSTQHAPPTPSVPQPLLVCGEVSPDQHF